MTWTRLDSTPNSDALIAIAEAVQECLILCFVLFLLQSCGLDLPMPQLQIAEVEVGAIFHCESVQSELVATCAVVTGQKQSQLLKHLTKPKRQ